MASRKWDNRLLHVNTRLPVELSTTVPPRAGREGVQRKVKPEDLPVQLTLFSFRVKGGGVKVEGHLYFYLFLFPEAVTQKIS